MGYRITRIPGILDDKSATGWPFENVLTVDSTNPNAKYSTIADAITAASAGDTILINSEAFSPSTITVNKSLTITGWSPQESSVTVSSGHVFNVTADNVVIRNLEIINTSTTNPSGCVVSGNDNLTLENLILTKTSGAATSSYGIWNFGGIDWRIDSVRAIITAGTNRYGYIANTAISSAVISLGSFNGTTADILLNHASASIELNNPILTNGALTITLGTATGKYSNSGETTFRNGLKVIDSQKILLGDGEDGAIYSSSEDLFLENQTTDKDIHLRVNDGGVSANVVTVDASSKKVGVGVAVPTFGRLEVTQLSDSDTEGIAVINSTGVRTFRQWVDGSDVSRFDSASGGGGKLSLNGAGAGNVGVQTIDPQRPLHVESGTTDIAILAESSDAGAYISMKDNSTTNDSRVRIGAVGDDLTLQTSGAHRLRIANGGNVGIGTTSPTTFKLQVAGSIGPNANKSTNLGSAALRWNTLYQGTSTAAGTSRTFQSTRMCPVCDPPEQMIRGTGSLCILGEDRDYEVAMCPSCGILATEEMRHLPTAKLTDRLPAPKIELIGFHVFGMSGNSRKVRVDFRYRDEILDRDGEVITPAVTNSTYLGEIELADFLAMTEIDRTSFLRSLGQREWDAMEEMRLIEEEVSNLQSQLDGLVTNLIETDLSR